MTDYAISYVTPGPRIGGELTRTSVALPHGDHDDLLLSSVVEKICIFITGFAFDLTAVLVAIAVFPVPDLIRYTLYVLLLMVIILFYIYHRAIIHDKSFVASCIWFLEHFDIASVKHYEQRLTDFEDNLKRYFTEHSPTLYTAMTVCLLSKALIAFQVYFLLAVLNIPGTLLHAVFLAAALDIAYAIPSYMGVGMLEAGQVSLFKLLKLPESIGVLVALVTRLRDLLFSGYGLLMIYIYGKN